MTQSQAMVVVSLGLILSVSAFLRARPWRTEVGANPDDRSQVWLWRLIEGFFFVVLVIFVLGLALSLLRVTVWARSADNRPVQIWPTGLVALGAAVWVLALVIGSVRRWLHRWADR